jgi:hypothetical protein
LAFGTPGGGNGGDGAGGGLSEPPGGSGGASGGAAHANHPNACVVLAVRFFTRELCVTSSGAAMRVLHAQAVASIMSHCWAVSTDDAALIAALRVQVRACARACCCARVICRSRSLSCVARRGARKDRTLVSRSRARFVIRLDAEREPPAGRAVPRSLGARA